MEGPSTIKLFTYRVGFGDCFLLRFAYADRPRHVLIDFGSTASAPNAGKEPMLRVAKDIADKCKASGNVLDAIVATHRHQDHIAGFAGKPWDELAKLKPRLVVMPWTEHPNAKINAETAAPNPQQGRLGAYSLRHVQALKQMHQLARSALDELELRARPSKGSKDGEETNHGPDDIGLGAQPFGKRLAETLSFLGQDNLHNLDAVKNLMGVKARDYLSFGEPTRLSTVLPGVTVHVLGPPTLEESPDVLSYAKSSQEYWSFAAAAVQHSGTGRRLFSNVKPVLPSELPLETRWFLKQLDAVRGEQLLQLVRILDDVMNNTSLILLFEACGKKLLFPGDAQVENWAHALSKPEVRELLKGVDVYKVGHHGSLNATPKSLWKLFGKKGAPSKKNVLRTFMSTRSGKHGHVQSGTEVPRKPLVKALEEGSKLFSTMSMTKQSELVHEEQLAP